MAWSPRVGRESSQGPQLLLGTVRGYLMLYDFAAKQLLWRKRTSHHCGIKLMAYGAGNVVALASTNLVGLNVPGLVLSCVRAGCYSLSDNN